MNLSVMSRILKTKIYQIHCMYQASLASPLCIRCFSQKNLTVGFFLQTLEENSPLVVYMFYAQKFFNHLHYHLQTSEKLEFEVAHLLMEQKPKISLEFPFLLLN